MEECTRRKNMNGRGGVDQKEKNMWIGKPAGYLMKGSCHKWGIKSIKRYSIQKHTVSQIEICSKYDKVWIISHKIHGKAKTLCGLEVE